MRSHPVVMLASLIPTLLAAQPAPAPPSPAAPRFSLTFEGGLTVSGPGEDLAQQLRDADFDDTRPASCFIFCSPPRPYPTTGGGSLTRGITASYSLQPALAIAVGYRRTSLGGATGYQNGGYYLTSIWEDQAVWVGVSWRPFTRLRLAVGPALHALRNAQARQSKRKLGVTGELAVENDNSKPILVSLGLRYTAIPTTDIPTHSRTISGEEREKVVTVRPNWNHVAVVLTFGLRM